ncbi:ATP-binding protein [Shewanella sp. A32]|uniref:sensor histidine kinase n=1 Tax=Shewanella sp. A32 TaxID=3031327 RepID=UPI0023B8E3DF|nr:ATP-binding protein [Shewanella sp. A32]MDF0533410.1 ATP-binding protein [Shewanella sp. A32]
MVNWYQRQKLIHQIGLVILIGFAVSFCLTLFLLSYDKSQRLSQLSVSGALQRVISIADTLEQTSDALHDSILKASSSSDLQLSLTDKPRVESQQNSSDMAQRLLQRLNAAGIQEAHIALVSQAERPLMDLSSRDMNAMHRSMMDNDSTMNGMMGGNQSRREPRYGRGVRLNYSATVDGSVKLSSGKWLNFSSGIENDITHWSTSVLIALASVMLLTVLISLFIVRRALKPISELGQAAQAFARNKQVHEVSNDGPRDLMPTIDAFNDMQHQVTDYISERTKLLAAISHDLRTPLTSLRLRVEFIEEGEDKQQLLRTINTMDSMLTATMRFAKNDAEKEARQMTNIDSLLQTIVDEYDEKGVAIHYQAQDGLTGNIPPLSVRRMTENLLNNAIQYAGNDAQIALSALRDADNLTICVSDNGVGIPADKLQEVVKPFARLNEARDTEGSNVGLGLAITHSLATAYGGSLTLAANQAHGLKATISLSLS